MDRLHQQGTGSRMRERLHVPTVFIQSDMTFSQTQTIFERKCWHYIDRSLPRIPDSHLIAISAEGFVRPRLPAARYLANA